MTIKVTYNVTDVYVTQDVSPVYINVSYSGGGSGGAAVWGGITGTLSDQTDLQTALDAKVPYTGATTNVDLGEYQLRAGQLTLDTSPTGTAAVGTTRWNDTIGSSETTLKGGSVILKNGVDLVARVVNKVSPNTTLTKAAYQAVRVSGAQGQRLAVELAQANNDANSADTIGLVTETIAANQEGFIMTVGSLENINTTGSLQGETWGDGDVLYLSGTTAGRITNVQPSAPIHIVVIGYVEYAHANNGKIYVKVMNGWELNELHNVSITSVANNEALIYESATALWKNKSIATALGYTPANAATTLTINGVTYDLSANRSWTVAAGISGSGASGQVAYWTGTSAVGGSADFTWDSNNLVFGNGKGIALKVAGTNRTTNLYPTNVTDNFAGVAFYPNTGTNVGQAFQVIPRGTGYSATIRAQFSILNTDAVADPTNFEALVVRATGSSFTIASGAGGTATNRPILLSSGFVDTITNPNHLWLYTSGNVGINTTSDSGQRLQVQGTTLLNGNVTFSSATGMFWDAANGNLGIGTTVAPAANGKGLSIYATDFPRISMRNSFTTDTASAGMSFYMVNRNMFYDLQGANNHTWVSNATERMRIFGTGNILIQSGGTFTDSGERLQVTGNVKIVGSGNTSAINALNVQDSAGSSILRARGDGAILIGASASAPIIQAFEGITGPRSLRISLQAAGSLTPIPSFNINQADNFTFTSGTGEFTTITANFLPTSGTGTLAYLSIKGTINQVGATGITRGLYINPTLTAAADFRAIETARGNVVFGNLPTSSAGLPTGAIWNDAGTIKIV